jgi:hypothetical protein
MDDTNKLLQALENETNSSIMSMTTSKIKTIKNNMLQRLQLDKDSLKNMHDKLKEYRYCSDMGDLQYGYYIRWIPLRNPSQIKLTNGAHLCDMKIVNNQIHIVCKNNMNRIIQIKLDEVMIFQKLSPQEKVILSVLDYLDKS